MKLAAAITSIIIILSSCADVGTNSRILENEFKKYLSKYKSINNTEHFLTKLFEQKSKKKRETDILNLFELAFENREKFNQLISVIDKHSTHDLLGYYEDTFGDSDNYSKFQELILSENDKNKGVIVEDFKFNDIYGNKHKISDYKGKLIVIDFWATWCKPCLALEDDFKKIVKKYEDSKNIQFISLAVRQSKEPWLNHLKDSSKNHPNLLLGIFEDVADFEIPKGFFDLLSIPKFAFIDKNGITIYSNGPQPNMNYFEKLIEMNK